MFTYLLAGFYEPVWPRGKALRPFLTGEHLFREHSSGYSSNLDQHSWLLIDELLIREPSSVYSSNCART